MKLSDLKVGQKISAKSSDLVITQQKGGPIQFWSGSRWVSEYPDAEKYPDMKAAQKANLKAKGDIVENYGMDDERVVGKLSAMKTGQTQKVVVADNAAGKEMFALIKLREALHVLKSFNASNG